MALRENYIQNGIDNCMKIIQKEISGIDYETIKTELDKMPKKDIIKEMAKFINASSIENENPNSHDVSPVFKNLYRNSNLNKAVSLSISMPKIIGLTIAKSLGEFEKTESHIFSPMYKEDIEQLKPSNYAESGIQLFVRSVDVATKGDRNKQLESITTFSVYRNMDGQYILKSQDNKDNSSERVIDERFLNTMTSKNETERIDAMSDVSM